jgi:hypothetical protein
MEESQLIISRRITATCEDQAARQHNMILLDDIANVWTGSRKLKCYTLDGSHKMFQTYADILTSHQDLADRRKDTGGIVFTQDKTQSIKRHSICAIPGETISGMTAYTWKLLMQLIGLHYAITTFSSKATLIAQVPVPRLILQLAHIMTSCELRMLACLCQQPTK